MKKTHSIISLKKKIFTSSSCGFWPHEQVQRCSVGPLCAVFLPPHPASRPTFHFSSMFANTSDWTSENIQRFFVSVMLKKTQFTAWEVPEMETRLCDCSVSRSVAGGSGSIIKAQDRTFPGHMLYNVKTLKGLTAIGDISLAVHTNQIYKQGIRDVAYEPARKKYSGARNGIIRERLFLHL